MSESKSTSLLCYRRHVRDITLALSLLDRPHLTALIDRTIKNSHIPCLMAPAGFGKRTVIKQWLYQCYNGLVLWLCPTPTGSRLDTSIDWESLSNKGTHSLLKQLMGLASPLNYSQPIEKNKKISIAIVLENVLLLPTEMVEALKKLQTEVNDRNLDKTVPSLHLITTSELDVHDIDLPFAPAIIDAEQIRLTPEETQHALVGLQRGEGKKDRTLYLSEQPKPTVNFKQPTNQHDPELISQINGWAILVSGLSAMIRANPSLSMSQQSTRFSQLSYELIDQAVLSNLSAIEYSVLETIETLPYLNQDMCQQIWPSDFTQGVLQSLKSRLLIKVDSRSGQINFSETWFNIHFHGRIKRYEKALHKKLAIAAQWYEEHQMIGYTLSCYVKLQKWDKVATLAQAHAETLAKGNDWQRVTRWLERLPQSTLTKYPKLMSIMAWQSISLLRKTLATDYISRASAINRPASLRQQPSGEHVTLIHKLQKVDVDAEIENLEDMSESLGILLEKKTHDQRHFLVNTMAKKSAHSANLQSHLQALQQLCNWELQSAASTCNRLIKQAMAERNATLTLNGLYLLGIALYNTGEHKSLAKQTQNIQRWLKDNAFEAHPLAAWSEACHCNILRESGQLDKSEALLQKLEKHFNQPDAPLLHKYTTWMLRAQQYLSQGDINSAQALADRADAIAHQLPLQFTRTMISAPAFRADALILQERYSDAKLILEPLVTSYWHAAPEQHDVWALALHYFLIGLSGDIDTMETQLKALTQYGAKRKHRIFEFYVRSLLCIGLYKLGEHRKARHAVTSLAKQLDIRGYQRLLLNRGKDMGNLLLKAGEKQAGSAALAHWIEALPNESYSKMLHYDFIKLSKREIEILALIAQGLTNEAISKTLCRSLGTVKLHVHNIYKKIGVSSRIQAIQKCEACGFDSELLSCYKQG